jgi:phosphinothricin acetyltransferase
MIRDATSADLSRINELYNTTIVENHVSFDVEPWDLDKRRRWWASRGPELVCLVAEVEGEVVGVAFSGWWRDKEAYRTSMETTIVLSEHVHGRGLGQELLGALAERLHDEGVHRAVAIIALPNEASVALHRKLGYREVGTLTEIGSKLGRYWDTMLMEKDL